MQLARRVREKYRRKAELVASARRIRAMKLIIATWVDWRAKRRALAKGEPEPVVGADGALVRVLVRLPRAALAEVLQQLAVAPPPALPWQDVRVLVRMQDLFPAFTAAQLERRNDCKLALLTSPINHTRAIRIVDDDDGRAQLLGSPAETAQFLAHCTWFGTLDLGRVGGRIVSVWLSHRGRGNVSGTRLLAACRGIARKMGRDTDAFALEVRTTALAILDEL